MQDTKRRIQELDYLLWAVLKVAGAVDIPRELLERGPQSTDYIYKATNPDGSVHFSAQEMPNHQVNGPR